MRNFTPIFTTFLLCLTISFSANAGIYKCTVTYPSGTKLTLNVSTPNQPQAKLVVLLSANAEPADIGKGTGFVSEGIIEYDRLGAAKLDQATLVVTNMEPLIAFFQDPYRVVSVRIDGQPPSAKITYYDAWFAPSEVAIGSCE